MTIEAVLWDEWYPVAVIDDLPPGRTMSSLIFGQEILFGRNAEGVFFAHRQDGQACATETRYHTHWVSLGRPPRPLFALPDFDEPDRRILGGGSIRVAASGLRVIENFLDMAHFPFVHAGLLGIEPHCDVTPYRVEIDRGSDEIIARDCLFYQPQAAATATQGMTADYVYRVARPLVAILTKTCPPQPRRRDSICLFVQPLTEESCVAHAVMGYLDDSSSDSDLRLFQQKIFGQDLTILANHRPATLPIEGTLEIPIPADALSTAYRRWLRQKGVRYGTTQRPAARLS